MVIPTLQRSAMLLPLVDLYARHELVGEVLVINNAVEPLHWASPKVRVLQQNANIYVNPAWNLGASEARFEYLIFSNDDIAVEARMLDATAAQLGSEQGMISACSRCVNRRRPRGLYFTPSFRRAYGTGIWFAMAKAAYVPIPPDLLIYCGDDWLFYRQHGRTNALLHGARIRTVMSTTSGDEAFSPIRESDVATYLTSYVSSGSAEPKTVTERLWSLLERIHNTPEQLLPWRRRKRALRQD